MIANVINFANIQRKSRVQSAEYRLRSVGTGRGVASPRPPYALGRVGTACQPSCCTGKAEFRVRSTDYGERAQVGAWLRRALLIRRARRSLAPTEFALGELLGWHAVPTLPKTSRAARSAAPTPRQKDSTWCCPYPRQVLCIPEAGGRRPPHNP